MLCSFFENFAVLKNLFMKNLLKSIGSILLIALIVLLGWIYLNLKDQNPHYKADLKIINHEKSELKAGFAAVSITPEVPDRWIDANNDAEYNPKDGDTFTDGNGNGKFDPIWIAGFGNRRAANGIHDDLWARTIVIDDGKTRLAIVALDVIGLMNNEVIDIKNLISANAGVTYAIISSTHTHEGPDMLGLWGKSSLKSGVNRDYMDHVKKQVAKSVEHAAASLHPVYLAISEDLTGANHLVKDTREPEVFDSGLRIIRVIDKMNGTTMGSLIAWGCHPETLWGKNLLISSDFPHFVREGIEKGVFTGDSLIKEGIGGIVVFINGAVGGLMTTHPSLSVKYPSSDKEFKEPSFEKAEAQGKQLALLALISMEKPAEIIENAAISLVARSFTIPINNKMFRLATALGILDRGTSGWMKMRTELAAFTIGPLSFATFPGEVYPEIVNGGIEAPKGRDFEISPVEVPAVREMMPGKYKFVIGLANDEIGYIIPKSQWDEKPPYTYGRKDSPYGEENSLGAGTASVIHSNLKDIFSELIQSNNAILLN